MVRGAKEELLRSNTHKVTKLEGKNGGAAPELLWSRSGAAPPFLPSNLVTLGVLLRSSSSLAPLTINFRRRKGAAPEPDEEQPL